MIVITIGRDDHNDYVLNDNTVSRYHSKIIKEDNGEIRIFDLNSKNGTFVNGQRVFDEVVLHKNDIVYLGDKKLDWESLLSRSTYRNKTDFINTRRNNDSIVNRHEVNEIKIDYNEGGFGRKFGQAAGDSAGNIVGCFIGIVIVIVLIILIGVILF